VEHVVVLVCGVTLTVVVSWLLLSVLVCLVDGVLHGLDADGRRGLLRPRLAQSVASAVLGALLVSSSGADATGVPGPGRPVLPHRLEGLALPDRPYGGVRSHRVEAGESLWSITRELLPASASDLAVARAWPGLHALNRDRIGADPDLIRPGTALRLPAWASPPTRGATR
jgi:nucleoid-associated protein YgaU